MGSIALRTLVLLSVLLALAACTVEREGANGHADADSVASVAVTSAASAPPSVSASLLPPPSDPEARAVCAAAAARWRAIPGVTVRELDTLLTATDVIGDPVLDTVPPPGAVSGRWSACAVVGFTGAGLDSTQRSTVSWPAAGWVFFPRIGADGPGGQVQVVQRGWVRCQVSGEWDPGDDGDSAYVPTPFHRERTFCWRHGRLVAPQDTMNLGG